MEPVRIAIIGAGSIGSKHAHLRRDGPACRLLDFAGPSPVEATLPAIFKVPLYSSYEEMLKQAKPPLPPRYTL